MHPSTIFSGGWRSSMQEANATSVPADPRPKSLISEGQKSLELSVSPPAQSQVYTIVQSTPIVFCCPTSNSRLVSLNSYIGKCNIYACISRLELRTVSFAARVK